MPEDFVDQDPKARQSYGLFPHMTVAENISFGPRIKKLGRDDGFVQYRGEIDRIRQVAKRIGYADIEIIPFNQVKRLRSPIISSSSCPQRQAT